MLLVDTQRVSVQRYLTLMAIGWTSKRCLVLAGLVLSSLMDGPLFNKYKLNLAHHYNEIYFLTLLQFISNFKGQKISQKIFPAGGQPTPYMFERFVNEEINPLSWDVEREFKKKTKVRECSLICGIEAVIVATQAILFSMEWWLNDKIRPVDF